MNKIDKKIELHEKLMEILGRRTQIEAEFEQLVIAGEHEKACDLLKSMDDQIISEIMAELDRLD